MELINKEIAATNEMIEEIYRKDKDAQLLTTISGIGVTLATLISTEIDGIERFSSSSKLCSYAGLVPSPRSSGGKTYHGRLTSEGNRWLRCPEKNKKRKCSQDDYGQVAATKWHE